MKKLIILFIYAASILTVMSQNLDVRISRDIVLKGDNVRACVQHFDTLNIISKNVEWKLYYNDELIKTVHDTGIFEAKCNETGLYELQAFRGYDDSSAVHTFEVIDTPGCKTGRFYKYSDTNNKCTYYFKLNETDTVYIGDGKYMAKDSIRLPQHLGYPLNTEICLSYYVNSGDTWCGNIWYSPPHPDCAGVLFDVIDAKILSSVNNAHSIKNRVYPNPFNQFIHVKLEENARYKYKITTLPGNTITSGTFNGVNKKIQLEHLNQGVYFLQLFKEGTQIETHKIIKK